MALTHFSSLEGRVVGRTSAPTDPAQGDEYYDTADNRWYRYNGTNWKYLAFTTSTTTSTSTTTTSTSTSTTTTSTSTSTTTTTSTSTSTSTTTTL